MYVEHTNKAIISYTKGTIAAIVKESLGALKAMLKPCYKELLRRYFRLNRYNAKMQGILEVD